MPPYDLVLVSSSCPDTLSGFIQYLYIPDSLAEQEKFCCRAKKMIFFVRKPQKKGVAPDCQHDAFTKTKFKLFIYTPSLALWHLKQPVPAVAPVVPASIPA